MYAIVDIAGKQTRVEQNKFIYANLLQAAEGEQVEFNKVLLIDNGSKVEVGVPEISGAKVVGKVVSHVKADKVLVFKKKRRKGHRKLNGHRQQYTKLLIESIVK